MFKIYKGVIGYMLNPELSSSLVNLIPKNIAYENLMVPLTINDKIIDLAISNEDNVFAINYVKFLYKREVRIHKFKEEIILQKLSLYYGSNVKDNSIEELIKDNVEKREKMLWEEQSPASRLVQDIINEAIDANASDIHIEPKENEITIRFRKDGVLFQYIKLPKAVLSSLVIRIKLLSNMNIAEKRIPQDGKISFTKKDTGYDIRVSSIPTINGEKLVLRILYKESAFKSLDNLGFKKEQLKLIRSMLNSQYGMILVTGPTGSGKSTTLYGMINDFNKENLNITTIEDPVEYSIKGINQINVDTKGGIHFSSGLRSVLRQDPDIIMIGEIRDEETAQIASRAAITGHKVLSTLHTNDCIGALYRLSEMGIKRYIMMDALLGVVSQSLVRKLCCYCKQKSKEKHYKGLNLNIKEEEGFYEAKGCKICRNTGYLGRVLVSEILYLDEDKKISLQNCKDIRDFRRELNIKEEETVLFQYKQLLLQGIIDYKQVIPIITKQRMMKDG